MSGPDEFLSVGVENSLDENGDTWQGGSHHAFNVAYEELKHRYNDLQERYHSCQRQLRGSRAGLEDDLFVRVSPSEPASSGGGPTNPRDMEVLHLQQTLSIKEREIEELRRQLESKTESEKRFLELQKENDQLRKLNHDLTYNNSEQVTKQLKEATHQMEMSKTELSILQKDYNAVLQENDNLLKKNIYFEQQVREKSHSPEKSLSNGIVSPVEQPDSEDVEMDSDDLQQMVVMSMSSKDEMTKLKETVWKLNEVIRILLRQQSDKKPSAPKFPGFGINGDVSMPARLPSGRGARPKVRSNVPNVPDLSRYATEEDDEVDSLADNPRLRRSQSMQYKKKPKNLDFRERGIDQSISRPKSNIEYTRYHVDLDKGKGHVKYTTHIKLQETEVDVEVPRDAREKNVFRSEQNRTRPIIDPRKGSSELGVSVYDRDDLPVREILAGGNRIDDILENPYEDEMKGLGSSLLKNSRDPMPMDDTTPEQSPEPDEFLTLTPAEAMLFEPHEPESPSWEHRNNRRSTVVPNSQTRGNGNPRPLNIDRNECDPNARSYDNNQGLNVNLNTAKDKFNNASSPQGFSILNNDPLVGNKTIPSKNIYQETSEQRASGSRVDPRPTRTAQEHDEPVVLRTCPICSETFDSTVTHSEFEAHVDACIATNNDNEVDSIVLQEREERFCPMCNKVFSDSVPQSEFEVHVNDHFDLNFEIVPSSEA